MPTKLAEMALSQSEACSFGPHKGTIGLPFRQLSQTAFRTLDFQLVEIPNGKIEKHPSSNVPVPCRLKQAICSQLVTICIETPTLVESRCTQIMLDQPEKSWTQRIIGQQLEKASYQSWLTPVHELERSTMGILGPEGWMVPNYPPSPRRIVKITSIRDPGELDFDPPAYQG